MNNFFEIPKEWEVKKIKEFAKTTAGGTPSTRVNSYWDKGTVRWMSSGDLNQKKIFDVDGRITDEGLKNSSARIIPTKSVLIGLAGQGKTRGTVAMNMVELSTNQSVAAILPNEKFVPEFLYYNLDSRYDELRKLSTGDGGRGGLNLQIINSVLIPFPKLKEQKAIVKYLQTWDNAIEFTEKLLSIKGKLKKGLMQQLLTGKKRLKGFNDKVKFHPLKNFITEVSIRNKSQNTPNTLSVTNTKGFVLQEDHFDKIVASENTSNYKTIKKGQFAYNPSRVNVGSLDRLDNFEEGILSPMYVVFETKKDLLLPEYLYFHLKSNWFYGHISMFVQGSVRDSLNFDALCEMKFFIPDIKEQKAISEIFLKLNDEIKLLKAKLEKLKEQKKGLMQVLLTGKVRVKI